ncbi:MAG: elongation factor G [Tepidisphaerales bacterium]
MPAAYSTPDIRNVLIAGHGQSGKTTLIDAMLFAAGAVNRKGSPADGSSFCDYEKEEKEHRHSIYAKLLHLDYLGKRINLIDTPGSPDLLGQALQCLPAVETVAVVISAAAGIEVATRRMMEAAQQRNLPRAIIINKIDTPDADLEGLVQAVQETFGPDCLPINLPTGNGKAVVECLLNKAGESDFGSVEACHTALLDHVADMDEALMERYLGGEEPNYEALHEPFEKAMDSGHIVPILFTDARNGVGVPELLDAIAKHFPSPQEGNLRPFVGQDEKPFEYKEDPAGKLLAHVFRVSTDPYVGKLSFFRVHQGKLTGQSQVFIGHNKKAIKLGHIFHVLGKEHREAQEIVAGDIGMVPKIDDIHPGDVLHDDHALDAVHLAKQPMPTPLYALAVTAKNRGDEGKLAVAFTRIAEEDPTFKYHVDRVTHEMVIQGLGELHLRLVLERLKNRGLQVETHPPKIAYRETITAPAEGHHRHKKQTGGAGQFGEVFLRVEPLPRGEGFQFVDEIFGGAIPGQFVPAVEKGCRDLLEAGPLSGHPLVDLKVTVYDGKHHPVDSKEVAFRTAGKYALKDAILKAKPVILEPIVKLDVTVPQQHLGTITGELSGKRGRILGTDSLPGGMALVSATAPLAEVMQFQSQLKSITGGQGSFAMELSHYDPVPPHISQQLQAAYKPHPEQDE